MATIILKGEITEDGQLKVELPPGLTPGPREIEIRDYTGEVTGEQVQGLRLGDLMAMAGAWADRDDIIDTVEFSRELRRRASRRDHSETNPE
jgi:hypothetical protein